MYSITTPEQFITTPWKNSLGETTELAINNGGSLTKFDWRLSMAKVTQDGVFSNFSGYYRQLILIEGNGIELSHRNLSALESTSSEPPSPELILTDKLNNQLAMAEFDGGNATEGKLLDGPIIDFNIITNRDAVTSKVTLINQPQQLTLSGTDLLFIYSVCGSAKIDVRANNQANINAESITLASGSLFKWQCNEDKSVMLSGEKLIVIQLSVINS